MKRKIRKARKNATAKLLTLPGLRQWSQNREFAVERKLLKSQELPTNDQPSVIHYSVNKAATQFTKSILLRCGQENGLITARFSDYAWVSSTPYLFTLSKEEVQEYLHVFRPKGILYTVFGGLVEDIPEIDQYRTIVMLRDPRDVLVSGYFSYSTSHAIPESTEKAKDFQQFRNRIKNLEIDDYVKEMCENTKWRMSQYMALKKATSSSCILRYEDMIADFPNWFDALLEHCQWETSDALKSQILSEAQRTRNPRKEDVSNHRRQVTPGDYERKLKPETIEYLNEQLSEALSEFNYN